jgi:competence protein ComEA
MRQVYNRPSHRGLMIMMMALLIGVAATITPVAQGQATKSTAPGKAGKTTKSGPVDVNSADEKTLETLPGIGPSLAGKIIAGRPYHNLEDLGKVKGLSKSKLDAIKTEVTFGPATTASGETKKTAKKEKPAKSAKSTETAESKPAPPAGSSTATGETGRGQAAPLSPTGHASGRIAPGEKININTASAEELDRLPGIGPSRAQAILDYRKQNGDFKTIEDIEKVKGIKSGEFSKLKDYIKVGD